MAKKSKPVGKLLAAKSMILRVAAGSATSPQTGAKYELSTSSSATPIIRSETSGRWWAIDWQSLIELAVAAGVDEPEAG